MKSMQTKALLACLAQAIFTVAGCQTLPQTDPNHKNGSLGDCQPTEKEKEFMEILFSDRLQKRKNMQCNAKLHSIAREKAGEWAVRSESPLVFDMN